LGNSPVEADGVGLLAQDGVPGMRAVSSIMWT